MITSKSLLPVAAPARWRGFDFSLASILLVALVLRCFNLGVPSLWGDEIQHAVTSWLSFPRLFEYTNSYREGLMYYFFVIKVASIFGTSEWMLRLPATLAGTLGVYFCYRLAKDLSGRTAGYIAALLAAVNLMLIGHARQAVSYGLFFLLDATSLWLFFHVARSRFREKSFILAAVNAAAILTYPSGFYLTVTEAGLLAIVVTWQWTKCSKTRAAVFFIITLLSLMPLIIKTLTFPADDTNGSFIAFNSDWGAFLLQFSTRLLEVINPANQAGGWAFVLVGLCVLGLGLLTLTDRLAAFSCLTLILVPAVGMFMTINSVFAFSHRVVYALPLLYALIGAAAARLIPAWTPSKILIPIVACVAAGYILVAHYQDIYGPEADRFVLFKVADFRSLALELEASTRPGSPIIFSELNTFRELRWYLSGNPKNHILTQAIDPGEGDLTVYFESNCGSFGHLSKDVHAAFVRSNDEQNSGFRLDRYNTLFSTVVHRATPHLIEGAYFKSTVTFDDLDYFREVYAQRKVFVKPYFGGRLLATENSGDCWFIYKYTFMQPTSRMLLGNITYDNTLTGNMIEVAVSSDGATYRPAHFGRGVGLDVTERFALYMPEGGQELYVRVKLITQAWPPGQYLFNANSLRLARFQLFGCDSEHASQCDYDNIVSSSPTDTNTISGLDAAVELPVIENTSRRESELSGWTIIEAAHNGEQGRVRVRVRKHGILSMYPRVGGDNASVHVVESGTQRQLLFLSGLDRGWSPMGMRYDLPLDTLPEGEETELDIILTGKGQLWSRGDSVIFASAP